MSLKNRIPYTLATLPLAGLLGIAGILLRGPHALPALDPAAWADAAMSPAFTTGHILLIAAYVLPFLGFWAIYALTQDSPYEAPAFWGFILSMAGTTLALPAMGISAFAGPPAAELYTGGVTAAADIIASGLDFPGLAVGITAGTLYTVGPLLLSIAAWRAKTFPRWAVILFLLHGVLLSFGFGFYPLLVTGWVMFTISGAAFLAACLQRG